MDSAPSPRMLAVFDAYTEYIEDTRYGCALLNAAAELRDPHPGMAVIRDHKRRVCAELERLLAEDVNPDRAASLAEHLFLLLEGGIAHRGIESDPDRMAQTRELAARLVHH